MAPVGGLHLVEWGAEALGTGILVLGGLSAVCLDFGRGSPVVAVLPSASWRLLLTGLLFAGTGSLVAVSPFGRRSGAHINPSVTLAFFATGHVHRDDLLGYVAAQCLGAGAGAVLLRLLWGGVAVSVRDGTTAPGPGTSPLAAVGIEALMTGILVATILLCVAHRRTARWTPLAVWIVVA
ncbi:major intrinsic protein, partial [mine drainage metagenome]